MKSRVIASVALGVALMLGASGCALISPQATTIPYSPSDGVTVQGAGPLQVRNALIVANDEGTKGNLVAAIVNPTSDSLSLRIEIGDGSNAIRKTVRVPASSTISLGTEATPPLLLSGIDSKPGTDLPVYFQSGDADGTLVSVPVLDGTLDYLADLVP